MSKRQITIKPTCMRELLSFPADRTTVLWEKINLLVSDPLPDGKVKKKLKGGDGIYRLRVADYRVFYQFGDGWVSLLGIRKRQEDTYDGLPLGDDKVFPAAPEVDLDVALAPKSVPTFTLMPPDPATPLPIKITSAWLESHAVPKDYHRIFLRCRTEDDLLDVAVPGDVLARVVDAVFPPALERVMTQPDLVVPSPEHLVRYKEGDLLGFLLNLDQDQVKLTNWALTGPTMVTGGAGTGKSTVALYRVRQVLERAGSSKQERLLFTTYTRALLTVTRQLLEQLLTPDQLGRVQVSTCDQVALDIVKSRRKLREIESDNDTLRRLKTLRKSFEPTKGSALERRVQVRALARISDRYLLEEFDWIITGRGLGTVDAYLEAPRPGRGVAFPPRLRRAVWELYEQFRAGSRKERFAELRNEAAEIVRAGSWKNHWDYVFVDEAQDLSPSALALMADVSKTAEGLFFAADARQSLYSRNYTWTAVHPRLQFRGRTANLRRNYRSTEEIDRAAFSILQPEQGESFESSVSVHHGPLPVLVRGVAMEAQAEWIARFVRQMARHLHLPTSAAAVLVPESELGKSLASALEDQSMAARFFAGKDLDLREDVLKVMTFFSAKGLEFPVVVIAGLHEGTYPLAEDFGDEDLFAERMRNHRRALYVACTRAMRGLMVVVPASCRDVAITELDTTQWHVEEIN